MSKSINPPPKP
ncbi:Hypothetical protein SSCIU_01577 [Mammaliicoccus sciuri]|nr:Hypothetical protein SSCIU_01577 [Mammaliicoccus sciuri]